MEGHKKKWKHKNGICQRATPSARTRGQRAPREMLRISWPLRSHLHPRSTVYTRQTCICLLFDIYLWWRFLDFSSREEQPEFDRLHRRPGADQAQTRRIKVNASTTSAQLGRPTIKTPTLPLYYLYIIVFFSYPVGSDLFDSI